MHGEIPGNIAGSVTGSLHRPALECDRRMFADVEKLAAFQMLVPFLDSGINAGYFDPRGDTGLFGSVPVEIDRPGKAVELAPRRAQQMPNFKTDLRGSLIKRVMLCGVQWSDAEEKSETEKDNPFRSIHNRNDKPQVRDFSRSGGL